jgi:hypothetical protein
MRNMIRSLEQQNESLQDQNRRLQGELYSANFRIQHDLMRFQRYWDEFRVAQAQLGQVLAHHDPHTFLDFMRRYHHLFDTLHIPQLIYEATQLVELDEDTMTMVRTLVNMSAVAAGESLERWLITNQPLMLRVLGAMSNSRRGEVLETLDAAVRSNMLLLMTITEPTFAPIVPYLRSLPPVETIPILPEPTPEPESVEEPESEPEAEVEAE